VSEADTCRKLVVPRLLAVGWDTNPHSIAEQRTITDGRIVPVGKGFVRKPPKRVDFLLRYTRDFPLAVVEAKANYKAAADGVQQAKTYAEMHERTRDHRNRLYDGFGAERSWLSCPR
jgi:type I restriction enzyme R subunit